MEKGYNVRGTVRDKADTAKVITLERHLMSLASRKLERSGLADGSPPFKPGCKPFDRRPLQPTVLWTQ